MTEFEKECSKEPYTGDTLQENVIEWLRGSDRVTVNLCNNRYATRVRKLAEANPDEVEIVSDREGVLLAHVPVSYIRIQPPKKMNYTEEQRAEIAERARKNFNKE